MAWRSSAWICSRSSCGHRTDQAVVAQRRSPTTSTTRPGRRAGDHERRVVGGVAARRRAVLDQHAAREPSSAAAPGQRPARRPARAARSERRRLSAGATGSLPASRGARARRVREHVHRAEAGRARPRRACRAKACSSSAGWPTITSLVRLRPGDQLPRPVELAQEGLDPVVPAHRRAARRRCPTAAARAGAGRRRGVRRPRRSRRSLRWLTSIDDSRTRSIPSTAATASSRPGQVEPALAVAEAAEVDRRSAPARGGPARHAGAPRPAIGPAARLRLGAAHRPGSRSSCSRTSSRPAP